MSNYKENRLFEKIADTYNLSVVLKEFCEQHQDIEEICNILPFFFITIKFKQSLDIYLQIILNNYSQIYI